MINQIINIKQYKTDEELSGIENLEENNYSSYTEQNHSSRNLLN
jgi:hypothetical protein